MRDHEHHSFALPLALITAAAAAAQPAAAIPARAAAAAGFVAAAAIAAAAAFAAANLTADAIAPLQFLVASVAPAAADSEVLVAVPKDSLAAAPTTAAVVSCTARA